MKHKKTHEHTEYILLGNESASVKIDIPLTVQVGMGTDTGYTLTKEATNIVSHISHIDKVI